MQAAGIADQQRLFELTQANTRTGIQPFLLLHVRVPIQEHVRLALGCERNGAQKPTLDAVGMPVHHQNTIRSYLEQRMLGHAPPFKRARKIAVAAHAPHAQILIFQHAQIVQAIAQKQDRIGWAHLSLYGQIHKIRSAVGIRDHQIFHLNKYPRESLLPWAGT